MTISAQIQTLIDENNVVLFMKGSAKLPRCGFSGFVTQVLDSLDVDYKDVDVLEDPEMRQGIKDFSNWPTVPQLYIKGEFIGGADIIKEMHQDGELQELLKKAS